MFVNSSSGPLILRKIRKTGAARKCFKAKYTKFVFRWAPPHTPLRDLTVLLQIPQLYLWGLILRRGGGMKKGEEKVKGIKGR